VRCETGFRPTERQRAVARRRIIEKRARERAAYALARRRERACLERASMQAYVERQIAIADDQVRALRTACEHTAMDRRLARLLKLRSNGRSLSEALQEVEPVTAAR
jgi:hypothetical protein